MWSRIHLVPLLTAEGDRDMYRRQQAALAREKAIMKDVPGWEVSARCARGKPAKLIAELQAGKSVYNNPKYHTPEIVVL